MKAKITASFLALFIFGAGFAGGYFLNDLCLNKGKQAKYRQFKKFMGPERFDRVQKHLQEKFTRELSLSLTQQTELKTILKSWMASMKNRVQTHDREMEAIKEEYRQKIREMLNDSQKERFNEMVREYKARQAKWKK